MPTCRFCAWLAGGACQEFWARSDAWDRAESNEWDLWSADSDRNRELMERALVLREIDPEAAFKLRIEAADAGSAWAMELVGRYYEKGILGEADPGKASEYYRRAIAAGSQMAMLGYARLLARQADHQGCDAMLEGGVEQDFVPACFWLAWYRYNRSPTRTVAREVRPLLERAADAGHPAADALLKRLMISGKLGIREIPNGLRRLWRTLVEIWRQEFPGPAAPKDTAQPTAAAG